MRVWWVPRIGQLPLDALTTDQIQAVVPRWRRTH